MAERARGIALMKPTPATEPTAPAGRLEAAEHAVPHRHALHIIACREHRADVLVADRKARLYLHAAVVDVQIRPTHPRRLDLYDRLAGICDLGLRDILNSHLAGRLESDGTHRGWNPIPYAERVSDSVSKAVLITGCSSGIGEATARRLAE